jgi:hypothetical protein
VGMCVLVYVANVFRIHFIAATATSN